MEKISSHSGKIVVFYNRKKYNNNGIYESVGERKSMCPNVEQQEKLSYDTSTTDLLGVG